MAREHGLAGRRRGAGGARCRRLRRVEVGPHLVLDHGHELGEALGGAQGPGGLLHGGARQLEWVVLLVGDLAHQVGRALEVVAP
eukprot:4053780-Prymnesium_polylepis.1